MTGSLRTRSYRAATAWLRLMGTVYKTVPTPARVQREVIVDIGSGAGA